MNYKAIEAALEKCLATEGDNLDCGDSSDHDRYVTTRALWVDACEALAMRHGPNILRIVRAMAWMEEQGPTVRDSRGVAAVEVYRDGCKETYFGPTIIDAIEAAMTATGQQTKGVDESA